MVGTIYGKCIFSIVIVVIAAGGAWNIDFDYNQFVWNRNVLRQCERSMQLYDQPSYHVVTHLKKEWKTVDYDIQECRPHYWQWMFVIAVVAAYSLYVVMFQEWFCSAM